jgi:hypothetical protein
MYMNLELPKQNYPAHVQSDEPLQSVPRGGLNYCNCSVRVRTAVRARDMVREGGSVRVRAWEMVQGGSARVRFGRTGEGSSSSLSSVREGIAFYGAPES